MTYTKANPDTRWPGGFGPDGQPRLNDANSAAVKARRKARKARPSNRDVVAMLRELAASSPCFMHRCGRDDCATTRALAMADTLEGR